MTKAATKVQKTDTKTLAQTIVQLKKDITRMEKSVATMRRRVATAVRKHNSLKARLSRLANADRIVWLHKAAEIVAGEGCHYVKADSLNVDKDAEWNWYYILTCDNEHGYDCSCESVKPCKHIAKLSESFEPAKIVEEEQEDGTIIVWSVSPDGTRKEVARYRKVQPEQVTPDFSNISTDHLIAEKKSIVESWGMYIQGTLRLTPEHAAELDARGWAVSAEVAKRLKEVEEAEAYEKRVAFLAEQKREEAEVARIVAEDHEDYQRVAAQAERDASGPAPDGYYTVVFDQGLRHVTLRLHTAKEGNFADKQIVSFLTGANNEADYTGFGFVNGRELRVWKRCEGSYKHQVAAADILLKGDYREAGHAYAMISKRCYRCNRLLTTPESIEAGIGPDCARAENMPMLVVEMRELAPLNGRNAGFQLLRV